MRKLLFLTTAIMLMAVSPTFAQTTFSNATNITVGPNAGNGSPYPSTIAVSGLGSCITNVTVNIPNISHTWYDDIDIMLVSPSGARLMLMSDCGGDNTGNGNRNYTFSDAAASFLSDGAQPSANGTYKPTDYEVGENVAPGAATITTLSGFNGTNPNGNWSLYARDDSNLDGGTIIGGWSITVTTFSVTAGLSTTICPGGSTTLSSTVSSTPPTQTTGSATFSYSGSGYDCDPVLIGGTTSGMPANATITSIVFNVTIGPNCSNWYSWDFFANYVYIGWGCNGTGIPYNGLNGQPANGQSLLLQSYDDDDWCDGINMTFAVTVNYVVSTPSTVTYAWTPSGTLNNASIANPTATPASTTTYTVTASAGGCSASASTTITVGGGSVGGTVTSSQSICYGSSPAILTLSGHTGTILNWQQSVNGGGLWTNIANTATTYSPPSLTTTTMYRAVVQNGSCPVANSAAATITVPTFPTTISGATTSSCTLNNENAFVYFLSGTTVVASVRDNTGAPALGSTAVTTYLHPSIQSYNGTEYMQRVTSIVPSGLGASRIRLYFTETEYQMLKASNPVYAPLSYSDLRVTRFTGVMTTPTGAPTIFAPTVTQNVHGWTGIHALEFDNTLSLYGTFFIHFGSDSPLPITLGDFIAECVEGNRLLKWSTVSEVNNDFFTIHRSIDLQNWEEVRKLSGAGNSNETISYEYIDSGLMFGRVYYRLTQTDYNGNYEVFNGNIVSVECDGVASKTFMKVYPNPTDGMFVVEYAAPNETEGLFIIYDQYGKTIQPTGYSGTGPSQSFTGTGTVQKNAMSIPRTPGVYTLQMIVAGKPAAVGKIIVN